MSTEPVAQAGPSAVIVADLPVVHTDPQPHCYITDVEGNEYPFSVLPGDTAQSLRDTAAAYLALAAHLEGASK